MAKSKLRGLLGSQNLTSGKLRDQSRAKKKKSFFFCTASEDRPGQPWAKKKNCFVCTASEDRPGQPWPKTKKMDKWWGYLEDQGGWPAEPDLAPHEAESWEGSRKLST